MRPAALSLVDRLTGDREKERGARLPYRCRTVVGTFLALSPWPMVHAQCVGVPNVPTGGVPTWTVPVVLGNAAGGRLA